MIMFGQKVTLQSGRTAHQLDTGSYWIDFIPGGGKLAVTFEPAGGPVHRPNNLRRNWGESFFVPRGYSFLSVKPKNVDWYRQPDLHDFFESDSFKVFIRQFPGAVVSGTSMGGFAALAFAEAFPNCLILAHGPQTTLDPDLTPWDKRFPTGSKQDWKGRFADGAKAAQSARRIYITYDPFHPQDRRHAHRVVGPNVVHLKMPFLGHGTPDWLLKMGVLTQVTELATEEKLDTLTFAKLVRRRRNLAKYYNAMYLRARNGAVKAKCLEAAVTIDPDDGGVLFFQIEQAFKAKNYARCIEIYQKNPKMNGLLRAKVPEVRIMLARALNFLGEREQAADLARSIKLQSSSARFLVSASKLFAEIEDYDLAEACASNAISRDAKRESCYLALAAAYRGQGRLRAAIGALEQFENLSRTQTREFAKVKQSLLAAATQISVAA